ncbi:MAG: HAMP domain-containing sensor histidine kinase [Patescibacteria group bacterium]|nr:HAMP domain-containing sensor histidine kinase [Patescibacteria group bacterium]
MDRTLLVISVILSALLFGYPIILFFRINRLAREQSRGTRMIWVALFIISILFYLGYVAVAVQLLKAAGTVSVSELINGSILAAGSIFVAMVGQVCYQSVVDLERLVRERTAQLERTYEDALKKEKEIQKLKDQFLFVAAHELRAPVTAMRWIVDIIRDSGCERLLKPAQSGVIRTLDAAVVRLLQLVNDLLDTSRLEFGTFRLKEETSVPKDSIEETIGVLSAHAEKKGIVLEYLNSTAGSEPCLMDSCRFQEVMMNLLSNAIKYNIHGGKVVVSTVRDGDQLLVSVADTGAGLSPEDITKLFQKFGRLDNHPAPEEQSTGLGLFIAKSIVEKWGGKIWAESPGRAKGSTFRFTLPIRKQV